MKIIVQSTFITLIALAQISAQAQNSMPDLPSVEDIERAENAARQRESRALNVATLAGIASGTVIVRSQHLKNAAKAALADFDRIKMLEDLRNQMERLDQALLDVDLNQQLLPTRRELLATLSNENSIAAERRAIQNAENIIARANEKIPTLKARTAAAKLALGLADDTDISKVVSDLDVRRTAFTHKLAGLQSADEFGETLAKIRAGRIDDVVSEMPGSAARRIAAMESKAKLMRKLGLLGIGVSATVAIAGTWGAYAQGDITTAREAAIEQEFNAMQNQIETGSGAGAVELPPPAEVLAGH
jgi:hypothetical protein